MSERLRGLRNFIDQKICGRKKDPDLNTLPTCLPADPSIKSGNKCFPLFFQCTVIQYVSSLDQTNSNRGYSVIAVTLQI